MLHKIFGARKLAPTTTTTTTPKADNHHHHEEKKKSSSSSSTLLKIIHAGGHVEQYCMAIPAARIIDKYPSFMLARPDVFRRPWDAIIRPEEILIPGQKYFLVPRKTVKKLKRRIKKPCGLKSSILISSSADQMGSQPQAEDENFSSISSSISFVQNRFGILIKSKNKTKSSGNRRVRLFGIDTTKKNYSGSSVSSQINSKNDADANTKKSPNLQPIGKKRRLRNIVQWQPSLTSISEDHCR